MSEDGLYEENDRAHSSLAVGIALYGVACFAAGLLLAGLIAVIL